MKKVFFTLILSSFILSCSGNKSESTKDLITSKNLEGLKSQKEKKLKAFNALKNELKQINDAIVDLDPSEKLPLISMLEIKPENFDHYVEIQANVKTRNNVLLYPEYTGTLKAVYAQEGQNVKKGKLLAMIDDAGLKDQLEQLEIQAELSKTIFDRTQRLWDQNIGSEIQLLQAKTTYNSQLKSIAQLKKQLNRTKIYAPFSGTIDEIIANTGANMMPGQTPVMRIVNLSDMYAEADVPERYLNRSFRVETPLENTSEMIMPNLNCKLKINDYSNPSALMIPLGVIKENANGQKYVYKLIPEDKKQVFRTQQALVELGKKSFDKVEVLSGIEIGDLIVEEGATIVEDNQRVKNIQ
jgi:membrane fusion protein (multidrug efflux system)